MYLRRVVTRHGIPVSIICDRDSRFASNFWRSLQNALCTNLDMSTAYHPQTTGKRRGPLRTLEDKFACLAIAFWKGTRKPMEFQVGDKVMLKVSPGRGRTFLANGEDKPRYVRPFKVIERVGEVAYKLELQKS
ncbi:putative reverse transcriptase domain-containing protein [Tanacetum coccineum]